MWRWDQAEPFGNNPGDEDPDSNSVDFDLPLRLPGQYFDKETNLHYNYFRDYSPDIGRYIESDPIGLFGGTNPYLYADANPVSKADAKGLLPLPPGPSQSVQPSVPTSQSGIQIPSATGNTGSSLICGIDYNDRCYKQRAICRAQCYGDLDNDRFGQGFSFFRCFNRCMEAAGCTP